MLFRSGGEQLAHRFSLPVWFASFERVGRGRYVMRFEELYDGKEEVAPNQIMQRYVTALEEMIKADPACWVWSHRRWKERPAESEIIQTPAAE